MSTSDWVHVCIGIFVIGFLIGEWPAHMAADHNRRDAAAFHDHADQAMAHQHGARS